VWQQSALQPGAPERVVLPFHLDTTQRFELMRAEGTPHSWLDAQQAWDHGRMGQWTRAKGLHAMGHYKPADLPFQVALANAFTVCDAYHCSFHGGTNTNRLFLWTGTNDPQGRHGGPATSNDLDTLAATGCAQLHLDHLRAAAAGGRHPLAGVPGPGRQLRRQPAGRLSGLP
jgi:phospholipase C